MKKFIAHLLYKNKAVKVIHLHENKKTGIYYALPVNGLVTVKEIDKTFALNPENIVYDKKRFPTIITNYKEPYVINGYNTQDVIDENGEAYTSDKLNVAISSKIGRDIFLSNGASDLNLSMLLSIATLIAVGVAIYFITKQSQDFLEQINQLKQIIASMGGSQ